MIATIYLPFLLYNEDVFHKKINTYDYVSYADTLINDYNKNKDVVNDYMNSGINNNSTAKFNANNQQNSFSDEEYTYCSSTVELTDIDGNSETIDNLLGYFRNKEAFYLFAKFNQDEMDEDVESELKMWERETNKINSYPQDEDWKIDNLPTKNLKISINNTAFADLKNCKIMEKYGVSEYAILVQEIIFTNSL